MIAGNIRLGMNAGTAMDTGSGTARRRTERSIQTIFQTDTTSTPSAFTTGSMLDTIEVTGKRVAEDGTTVTDGSGQIQKGIQKGIQKACGIIGVGDLSFTR